MGFPRSRSTTFTNRQIDLLKEGFISERDFKEATLNQCVVDLFRDQKKIYFNGKSFDKILFPFKQEMLRGLINTYLAAAADPKELMSRVTALQAFSRTLLNYKSPEHKNEEEDEEKADVNLEELPEDINKFLDQLVPLLVPRLSDMRTCEFASSPEIDAVSVLMQEANQLGLGKSRERGEKVLIDVWRNTLLEEEKSDERKNKFLEVLGKLSHQGGVLYALYLKHIENNFVQYYITGTESAEIHFDYSAGGIEVTSAVPIIGISAMDNPNQDLIPDRNKEDKSLLDLMLETSISLNKKNESVVKINKAYDYVHNNSAIKLLLNSWTMHKELILYADNYMEHGHDPKAIKEIIKNFPNIKEYKTQKDISSLKKLLVPGQQSHHEGDQVLSYIASVIPEYANKVLEKAKAFGEQGDEARYIRSVKLLRRLGKADLAMIALYPERRPKEEKQDEATLSEAGIKKIYKYNRENGLFGSKVDRSKKAEAQSNSSSLTRRKSKS